MGCKWNPIGFQFSCFLVLNVVALQFQSSWSLNSEGYALLRFRARVDSDPHGTFVDWSVNDSDPCLWYGVQCVEGKVHTLDLSGRSLGGKLASELSQLTDLRFLILCKNNFSGGIPKEFRAFTKLELLDLRSNKLSGNIPVEIGEMLSLKHLLLCDNQFEGSIPKELVKLSLLSELQFDENLDSTDAAGIGCANRKIGHCIWRSGLKQLNEAKDLQSPIKGAVKRYISALPLSSQWFKFHKESPAGYRKNFNANLPSYSIADFVVFSRRRLLDESSNLAAVPATGGPAVEVIVQPIPRSSGAFPAVPNAKKRRSNPPAPSPSDPVNETNPTTQIGNKSPSSDESTSNPRKVWLYVIIGVAALVFIIILAFVIFICQKRAVKTIGPWKTGLSGQLQKAFVTGVPKLNRSELETACEDFSNIIDSFDGYTVYKGTLSSGVEIAVASTAISSANDWTRAMEMAYRRKIDTLSRINHKNFVNLIGYCEEDEPFNRMMVFEYAPNGTLFEHLHVKEMEHLDWTARMRIIMGTAYCLHHIHELNPPIAHSYLCSSAIFLTDDYAAKVAEICFSPESSLKSKASGNDGSEHSVLPPLPEPETNIYSFGILLLEIVSGKLAYSEEQGPIEQWAEEYLSNKKSTDEMVDPTLKSFKNEELEVICQVINECFNPGPRQRPTMKDVVAKLREVINISPDQATPRLSPLWWAELEILSSEAT